MQEIWKHLKPVFTVYSFYVVYRKACYYIRINIFIALTTREILSYEPQTDQFHFLEIYQFHIIHIQN